MNDISVGDTFFVQYPKNKSHLFFVIMDICEKTPNLYICAMLSSWKDDSVYCDPACIINKGEHPFVDHKSYIAYRGTIVLTKDDLSLYIDSGRFRKDVPASSELIERIRKSALKSKALNPIIRNYLIDRLLH